MTAQIIDGKKIAAKITAEVAKKVSKRRSLGLSVPGLSVILVGNNPASTTYVNNKKIACESAGIKSIIHHLPENTTHNEIANKINELNNEKNIHGILLQLPLPNTAYTDDLLELINPKKDVDGFHPYNLGRLVQRRPLLRPCTPYGVMNLLKSTGETLAGKTAVVVGASNIVGRPMALELLLAKVTPTICHRNTLDLKDPIENADILISATGHYGVIKSEWIKPGAIVIDVGFSRLSNGKITGDIDFNSAKKIASWITPVPGGVGPMTVATLLQNTLLAAELQD